MKKNKYNITPRMTVKDTIIHAFQEMLKVQPFEDLTIHELVAVCGVSRTSFYRHFADKYDLLIQIYKKQVDEVCENPDPISEKILQVIELMFSEKKYFASALLHDKQNTLKNYIFQRSQKIYISHLQAVLKTDRLSDDMMTSINFACAGSQYVWTEWLLQGAQEPPQVIAKRIFDNIPEPVRRYCK